jgi:protein gp37
VGINSTIEWTESTWNPVTGCTKISPGCAHCYAERIAMRLKAMGRPNYVNGFQITLHENSLDIPLRWKKPQIVFVNSMSDLFHEDVPPSFIKRVFAIMQKASWHKFQILTKRAERLAKIAPKLPWPENIWMGVSVENSNFVHRIDSLRKVNSSIRFLSIEPLLGPLPDLNLSGINWIIVGGESGPNARPMKPEWIHDILDQCKENNVPFFFKQWGGRNKKKAGRLLNGKIYNEMPLIVDNQLDLIVSI